METEFRIKLICIHQTIKQAGTVLAPIGLFLFCVYRLRPGGKKRAFARKLRSQW